MLHDSDIKHVLFTEEQVRARVRELGRQITADYAGESPVLVAIIRGAVIFFSDLVREIDLDLELDFMQASSYGSGSKSSGVVAVKKDLSTDIAGRHVIIVEDILDTGNTLLRLAEVLRGRGAKSVEYCALLYKDDVPKAPGVSCKYVGFHVPDEFIVGYGLDYAERYRNLPYIGTLHESIYARD